MMGRTASADLIILGGGGQGRVVLDIAMAQGRRVRGFYDDTVAPGQYVHGLPVLGGFADSLAGPPPESEAMAVEVIVGVGDAEARRDWGRRLVDRGRVLARVVHPSAVIAADVALGPGVMVGPLAVIMGDALVGAGVMINNQCGIGHHCRLGDASFVGPGSQLTGRVQVGEGAILGAGVVVAPAVCIGAWARIGAGAAVLGNVPDRGVLTAPPARPLPPRQGARPGDPPEL